VYVNLYVYCRWMSLWMRTGTSFYVDVDVHVAVHVHVNMAVDCHVPVRCGVYVMCMWVNAICV